MGIYYLLPTSVGCSEDKKKSCLYKLGHSLEQILAYFLTTEINAQEAQDLPEIIQLRILTRTQLPGIPV